MAAVALKLRGSCWAERMMWVIQMPHSLIDSLDLKPGRKLIDTIAEHARQRMVKVHPDSSNRTMMAVIDSVNLMTGPMT